MVDKDWEHGIRKEQYVQELEVDRDRYKQALERIERKCQGRETDYTIISDVWHISRSALHPEGETDG